MGGGGLLVVCVGWGSGGNGAVKPQVGLCSCYLEIVWAGAGVCG